MSDSAPVAMLNLFSLDIGATRKPKLFLNPGPDMQEAVREQMKRLDSDKLTAATVKSVANNLAKLAGKLLHGLEPQEDPWDMRVLIDGPAWFMPHLAQALTSIFLHPTVLAPRGAGYVMLTLAHP